MNKYNHKAAQPLRLTDPTLKWNVEEELINAVITAAVYSEGLRPGIWQDMIRATAQGASKTKEETANAFFFRAMVDRLLEEFHTLEAN